LSGGARFIRGFKRIGAAIAALIIVIGVPITIGVAWNAESSAQRGFEQAICIIKKYPAPDKVPMKSYSSSVDFSEAGCSGPLYYESIEGVASIARSQPKRFAAIWEPAGIGLATTFGTALVVYVVFWAIGWIFAGFTRD
jgi:hypothetical protein